MKLNVNQEKIATKNGKLKLLKGPLTFTTFTTAGMAASQYIKESFPHLIQVKGTELLTRMEYSNHPVIKTVLEKVPELPDMGRAFFASFLSDPVAGWVMLGMGAATGALAYGGYRLVKAGVKGVAHVVGKDEKIPTK